MTEKRFLFLLVILIASYSVTFAQKPKKEPDFRSPVNFPITLAGSFGEIRRNHFHSGIDIRTGGAEGKPVYAIADGTVSRVNISAVGFGKALYIDHPDGYTSLYAHLQRYAGAVAVWVKRQQYDRESFTMDTEVKPGVLKVKKGDLIAYSGNSGSSGGPHIHFEIRETKSQEILDPLDFGFMKPDQSFPKISHIKIFPRNQNAMVDFIAKPRMLTVTGSNGIFRLKGADTIHVTGSIIFGIETTDAAEGGLTTGVHVIKLKVDGETVFSQNIDRFAFSETRYINSLLDYPAFVLEKHKIQRSYVAPNNRMNIFKDVKNQGIVHFSDAKVYKIQYEVEDAFGNTSRLAFYVKSHPAPGGGARPGPENSTSAGLTEPVFTWKKDNNFTRQDLNFEVPKEAVYEDFSFNYSVEPAQPGTYAPVHELHNNLTPLHTWCSLKIRCKDIPPDRTQKALVVSVSGKNKFASVGGKFENGWITTRIREFGRYTVALDTRPPSIVPVNVSNNKNIKKQTSIRMKISDDLSGIETYRGTINGKWILMEYDAKSRLLVYTFEDHIRPGKNNFKLVVTDAVGNTSRYEATLNR